MIQICINKFRIVINLKYPMKIKMSFMINNSKTKIINNKFYCITTSIQNIQNKLMKFISINNS
jgi:hypothetical protein